MPTSTKRARLVGGLCALVVVMIWTSFILIARVSAVHSLLPFDIAFLRFAFSALVALPLLVRFGPEMRAQLAQGGGSPWARGAALTALGAVGYCCLAYSGFFFAPVAHASVLLPGSLPLWTALIAFFWLHERVSPQRALGLALIIAGGALVGGASLLLAFAGGNVWQGDLLFMAASVCWSMYTVLCRRWRLGAMPATLVLALGSGLSFVPLYGLGAWAGFIPSKLAQAPWAEIAFQAVYQGGVSMWLAGLAFTQVIVTFGPTRTTLLTSVVPALAALLAVPLLGEALQGYALIGLACVTLGVVLGLHAPAAPLKARPA